MALIKTKCVCIEGNCERKYLNYNDVISKGFNTLGICRSLISSRINRHYHEGREHSYGAIDDAYIGILKDYVPHFKEMNFNYSMMYGTQNDLINQRICINVLDRPWISISMSVKEFMNFCFEYPSFMYANHNEFKRVCNDYFDSSYSKYKKYKTKYARLKTLVKNMNWQTGTTLEISINELLEEFLLLQSKVKKLA